MADSNTVLFFICWQVIRCGHNQPVNFLILQKWYDTPSIQTKTPRTPLEWLDPPHTTTPTPTKINAVPPPNRTMFPLLLAIWHSTARLTKKIKTQTFPAKRSRERLNEELHPHPITASRPRHGLPPNPSQEFNSHSPSPLAVQYYARSPREIRNHFPTSARKLVRVWFDIGSRSVRIRFGFGSRSDRHRSAQNQLFGSNRSKSAQSVWNRLFGSKSLRNHKSVRNWFANWFQADGFEVILNQFWTAFEPILNWFWTEVGTINSPCVSLWAMTTTTQTQETGTKPPSPHAPGLHPHPTCPNCQTQTCPSCPNPLAHVHPSPLLHPNPDPHAWQPTP